MNRLNLDFTIPSEKERKEYVDNYITEHFTDKKLTVKEMETIANYILFGKDENGKNAVSRKEVEIDTRKKTWTKKSNVVSLDELLDSPTFDENTIKKDNVIYKKTQETFSRTEHAHIKELHPLWEEIDQIDLTINLYEEHIGKRSKPIRPALLAKFTDEEISKAKEAIATITPLNYSKLKHLLVEKRTEQYYIKDKYSERMYPLRAMQTIKFCRIDKNILIAPIELYDPNNSLYDKIFSFYINPCAFSKKEILKIEDELRQTQKQLLTYKKQNKKYIDFTNHNHIYLLIKMYQDLIEENNKKQLLKNNIDYLENNLRQIVILLDFYCSITKLTEPQKMILKLKKQNISNYQIQLIINKQFSKKYSENYISTIFNQQICKKIAKTAQIHFETLSQLSSPDKYKKCNRCGKKYLKNEYNFHRRTIAADGYSNVCKICASSKGEK